MEKKWHILSIEDIEKELNTDLSSGLSTREARKRLDAEIKRDGGERESLFVSKNESIIKSIFSFLLIPSVLAVISVAAIAAFFSGSLEDLLVCFITLLGSLSGGTVLYVSQKRSEKMREFASPMVRVERNGHIYHTDGKNVVSGDVIILSKGDVLPCDARLIHSEGLEIRELINTKNGIRNRNVSKAHSAIYASDDEARMPNIENMLYAGSAVMSGEARAVAVVTGKEVYLYKYCKDGVIAGKDDGSKMISRHSSSMVKITFICTASVIILTLLSLITFGGKASLSCFLMLASAISMLSSEMITVLHKCIFSSFIDKLSHGKNKKKDLSAYIRDQKTFENLSDVTDIILLGSAAYTNGIYRSSEILLPDGCTKIFEPAEQAERGIARYVYYYLKALDESGIKSDIAVNGMTDSLLADLNAKGFDKKGADLVLQSLYFSADDSKTNGYACIETADESYRVILMLDRSLLSFCSDISNDYISEIDQFTKRCENEEGKCIYIISESDREAKLEGVLSLYEGRANNIEADISQLNEIGVRVSSVTDFDEEQVAAMIDQIHENGGVVAVYGIDDKYYNAMSRADIAISSDTVDYASQKHSESNYEQLPFSGRDTNLRCSQLTKLLSRVIVRRTNSKGGGLTSITNAVKRSKAAGASFSCAILFIVSIMCSLIPFAAMSAVVGIQLLNAAQVVAMSFFTVIFSLIAFSSIEPKQDLIMNSNLKNKSYLYYIIKNRISLIVRLSVNCAFAVIVKVLDLIGIFGDNATYTMPIFISILIISAVEIFLFNIKFTQRGEGRRRTWMTFLMLYAVILLISAVMTQTMNHNDLYPYGIGTYEFVLTLAHCFIYIILISSVEFAFKKRNKQ